MGGKLANYPIHKYEPQIKELLECCAEVPNQFWAKEQHFMSLPYKDGMDYASPNSLLSRHAPRRGTMQNRDPSTYGSKAHWASPAFYVNKHSEQIRGKKRLVIDYRKLNDCLQDIRYPIPRRTHFLKRIARA